VLFLHAHLPYVRDPEEENGLAEGWFFEAVTETYLPLLSVAEGWLRDRLPARLTVSLSPPLLEMLRDELMIRRYVDRMHALVELADSEVRRTRGDERFRFTAELNRARLVDALDRFENRYGRDLVAAFATLQDHGTLEVVTSCATHAFLPAFDASYARAQIRLGAKCFEAHLGRRPAGMWLPECGFVPGIDRLLADEGIGYFLVDAHALEFADPLPVFGVYAPVVCPSGVFAFGRDLESSAQVWSAEAGYPGDARYREFYRDVGHDLDGPSVAPFVLPDGGRINVGLKYHRVTGRDVPLHEKQPYHRGWALEAVNEHAGHFVHARVTRFEEVWREHDRPPVIVAPYDAELFGHWWFEGPEFLDLVVRKSCQQSAYRLATPSDVANSGVQFQLAMPAASSWGAYGYSEIWLNRDNEWIWPHLHRAAGEMSRIARERPTADGLTLRALNQLARELVLASASDWPFMISMGTTVEYAESRLRTHINRFNRLLDQIQAASINEDWLSGIEASDRIFPFISYTDFDAERTALEW
jgi:1,4-alpha-glucan branching enzyme